MVTLGVFFIVVSMFLRTKPRLCTYTGNYGETWAKIRKAYVGRFFCAWFYIWVEPEVQPSGSGVINVSKTSKCLVQ
jgi:hypothetical protein